MKLGENDQPMNRKNYLFMGWSFSPSFIIIQSKLWIFHKCPIFGFTVVFYGTHLNNNTPSVQHVLFMLYFLKQGSNTRFLVQN